jgi:type IV secretion system protein TrbJ
MNTQNMKSITKNILLRVALATILMVSNPIYAIFGIGDVVFDPANVAQTTSTAIEEVSQTLKQVQEYATQLQQYENQLQNTLQPASFIWNQASPAMRDLLGTINTLSQVQSQFGNLPGYLAQFKNISSYTGSPCFTSSGCSPQQWAQLANSQIQASAYQKSANDASIQGLAQQQAALQADANTLEQLQAGAQGATGQMQAIGYANQLASSQANQLLQIRGLLIAQQNAITARNQALADREAQQAAASEQLRLGQFKASSGQKW